MLQTFAKVWEFPEGDLFPVATFVFHKHKTFTFGQRNINMVIEEIRPTSPEQIPTTWWSCSTWWSDSHLDLK